MFIRQLRCLNSILSPTIVLLLTSTQGAVMFAWNKSYESGDLFIDNEHKLLIRIANKIIHECGSLNSRTTKQYLMVIFEYTHYHFQHEEEILRKIKWDGLTEHQQQHKQIITEMTALITKTPDIASLQVRLSQLLRKWVIDHIIKEDNKYRSCLIRTRGHLTLDDF